MIQNNLWSCYWELCQWHKLWHCWKRKIKKLKRICSQIVSTAGEDIKVIPSLPISKKRISCSDRFLPNLFFRGRVFPSSMRKLFQYFLVSLAQENSICFCTLFLSVRWHAGVKNVCRSRYERMGSLTWNLNKSWASAQQNPKLLNTGVISVGWHRDIQG